MSCKWQGALVTILEAEKDVCLVNEAEEKSGPVSGRKKSTRTVHYSLFLFVNVISKTSGKLVQATVQCHSGHVSKRSKPTCQVQNLIMLLRGHCSKIALRLVWVSKEQFTWEKRTAFCNRTAPQEAVRGMAQEQYFTERRGISITPGALCCTRYQNSTPGNLPASCHLSS